MAEKHETKEWSEHMAKKSEKDAKFVSPGDIKLDEGIIDFFECISTLTFDEKKILSSFLSSIEEYQKKPTTAKNLAALKPASIGFMIACQLSIHGYSNKMEESKIRVPSGDNATNVELNVIKLLDEIGVKKVNKDTKLKPEDVTMGRIVRLFRDHVRDYILKKKVVTYMSRKYWNGQNSDILFPGGQFLDGLTDNEVVIIMSCYHRMDKRMKTDFCSGVYRVYNAKSYHNHSRAYTDPINQENFEVKFGDD
jgi:hypothetical protein